MVLTQRPHIEFQEEVTPEFLEGRAQSIVSKISETLDIGSFEGIASSKLEKVKALINEFNRIRTQLEQGAMTEEERGITRAECEFSVDLLRAVLSVFQYVGEKSKVEEGRKSDEVVRLGSQANVNFLKLFIQLGSRYGFGEDEMLGVYRLVFSDSFLKKSLKLLGEERTFSSGIYGVAKAFSYLRTQFPGAVFSAPLAREDIECKVDLRSETDAQLSLFQIKGVSEARTTSMYDITDEHVRAQLESAVYESRNGDKLVRDIEILVRHAEALQKEYVQRRIAKTVRAYWVQVEPER